MKFGFFSIQRLQGDVDFHTPSCLLKLAGLEIKSPMIMEFLNHYIEKLKWHRSG